MFWLKLLEQIWTDFFITASLAIIRIKFIFPLARNFQSFEPQVSAHSLHLQKLIGVRKIVRRNVKLFYVLGNLIDKKII